MGCVVDVDDVDVGSVVSGIGGGGACSAGIPRTLPLAFWDAAAATPPAGASVSGGGTPTCCNANEAIFDHAGAATAPPVYCPPPGSSMITMIDNAGCSAGTNPTKVDWYFVTPN